MKSYINWSTISTFRATVISMILNLVTLQQNPWLNSNTCPFEIVKLYFNETTVETIAKHHQQAQDEK